MLFKHGEEKKSAKSVETKEEPVDSTLLNSME